MKHSMKLCNFPFELIKTSKKNIEIRLNDLKRQKLNIGDEIEFTKLPESNEKVNVTILTLTKYPTFRSLVEDTPLEHGGPHWLVNGKEKVIEDAAGFYDKEKEEKFGYLKIGIKPI